MARIGVVRLDLVGPVFLNDLETVSQRNFPNEPPGQTRYISPPQVDEVQAWMDDNGITAITAQFIIATCVPAGGPVDVRIAPTIDGLHATVAALPLAAKVDLQNVLTYSFVETSKFMLSFDRGVIAAYADAAFEYEGVVGELLQVVDDDGFTPYVLP
jgi:hypothetical protein